MIDEVLKIVNKFIPDKTDQAQVTIELAKLEIEEKVYKIKGYLDTGNGAVFKELPVIFVNFSIPNCEAKETIMIQGIQSQIKQTGYKATLFFQKKKISCYVIYLPTIALKHHCNCLLNVNLLS